MGCRHRENLERQVAFSPDGKTLAVAETLTKLSLRNIQTGHCLRRYYGIETEHGFAFELDGKTPVSGGPHFRFWDVARGHEVHRFPCQEVVCSIAFSPDGKSIATTSGEELRIWEASSGRELRRFTGQHNTIRAVAFAPDGKMLASSGNGGTLQLWDMQTGREIRRVPGLSGLLPPVAFAPDGKSFAAGDTTGIRLWDLAIGQDVPQFPPLPNGPIDALCFGADGRTIAFSRENDVVVWSLENHQTIKERSFKSWIFATAPDCKTVAVDGLDEAVRLWKLSDNAVIDIPPARAFRRDEPPTIFAVAFSPDGKMLASAGDDSRVTVRDPVTGKERTSFVGHQATVLSLAFAPDSKTLASGSVDGTVLLWDLNVVDK
jgi:WD40 repeat protein